MHEEKQRTTYNRDYGSRSDCRSTMGTVEPNINDAADDDHDDDDELVERVNNWVPLKSQGPQRTNVKFVRTMSHEPFVVPISEYRSTIHAIGKRIMNERTSSAPDHRKTARVALSPMTCRNV